MIDTSKRSLERIIRTDEAQHLLPCEIDLGAYRLLLNSNQSIELMPSAQGHSEPAYVLCLDATEAYQLMQCLNDLFKQTTHG
ncbi:MAG TPA: hypothetical protein VKY19_20230 [Ktedonosporobacter sp.]|jgi:hypothetical protein|nr:hypothetical protein [Ktedonosporobacter sp.]